MITNVGKEFSILVFKKALIFEVFHQIRSFENMYQSLDWWYEQQISLQSFQAEIATFKKYTVGLLSQNKNKWQNERPVFHRHLMKTCFKGFSVLEITLHPRTREEKPQSFAVRYCNQRRIKKITKIYCSLNDLQWFSFGFTNQSYRLSFFWPWCGRYNFNWRYIWKKKCCIK